MVHAVSVLFLSYEEAQGIVEIQSLYSFREAEGDGLCKGGEVRTARPRGVECCALDLAFERLYP